jgi:hypothetical protein
VVELVVAGVVTVTVCAAVVSSAPPQPAIPRQASDARTPRATPTLTRVGAGAGRNTGNR